MFDYARRITCSCFMSSKWVKSSGLYCFQFNKDCISVNGMIQTVLNTFFFSLSHFLPFTHHDHYSRISDYASSRMMYKHFKVLSFAVCVVNLKITIFLILVKNEILCFIPSSFYILPQRQSWRFLHHFRVLSFH